MLDDLKTRLSAAACFPSPPAIALQIIERANDPEISSAAIAALIAKDPGLASKVLRVANSPIYSKRRKSDNLRQALVTLGLNAAVSLALGFSLLSTYRRAEETGLNYPQFWRRSIFCAAAARQWAAQVPGANQEDIFLASLLQDIAVLAIDRVHHGFYAKLNAQATHADLIEYELSRLGADHAVLGGWLLRHWNFPENLWSLVERSHETRASANTAGPRCISLSSQCADVLLGSESPDIQSLAEQAAALLEIDQTVALETILSLMSEVAEVERLFETSILDAELTTAILDQARELLSLRTAQANQDLAILTEKAASLEYRMRELETRHQRDSLTGAFTRAFIDDLLQQEFASAEAGGWPLSVVFADLDSFKKINDTYGHAAGDAVLVGAAKSITDVLRDSDYLGRYGGEEFLIVLPGLSAELAGVVCNRLLAGLRKTRHALGASHVQVTISLGLATHSRDTPFASAKALIDAADRGLYSAKRAGRDRMVRIA